MTSPNSITIVSGGQTGADRAALDAAIAAGIPHGGFCPAGREAEDGTISSQYQLQEIDGGYRQRTRRNAVESDGTVIFMRQEVEGGTALTVKYCMLLEKPMLLIDMAHDSISEAEKRISRFVQAENIRRLNVAGPRASKDSGVYQYVFATLQSVFADPRFSSSR